MAAGATILTFDVQIADVDRGVYEQAALRMARHPSETDAFLVMRLLAYCFEYEDGIAFTEGVSATDEPAVLVRDATGRVTAWIEVGAPAAERLHLGSRTADRTRVWTHRDPAKLVAGWAGSRIHDAAHITVHSFDTGFVDAAAALVGRRNTVSVSRIEGRVYLDLNGTSLESDVHDTALESR